MKKTTFTALSLAAALFAGQALAADTAPKTSAPKAHEGHGGPGGHHKPGQRFEDTDTNKDGVVTKEEFHAQGDKIFAKLDTNGDGKITQDERDAKRKEWQAKRAEWKAKKEAGQKDE